MVKDVTTIKSQEGPQNVDPKPVVVIESAKLVSINPNISVRLLECFDKNLIQTLYLC